MIGLMPLLSKLVIFGLDLFVRNRAKREQMRADFDKFVKKFDKDSKESGNLHQIYKNIRRKMNGKSK